MRMTAIKRAIALVPALAAIAASAAAPAGAATYGNGFQVAKFKVEIEGSSKTSWNRNHQAQNECDVSDESFGSERLTFESTKPIYIVATHAPGALNPTVLATNAKLGIPTRARVQRSYTPVITNPTGNCLGSGGGGDPTPPDCGTRVFKPWMLQFEFSHKRRDAVELHSDSSILFPYEFCPGSLYTFPYLLDVDGIGRKRPPLYAELPADDLFDPKFRKWITIGRGSWKEVTTTWFTKTEVRWSLSFTRLGR